MQCHIACSIASGVCCCTLCVLRFTLKHHIWPDFVFLDMMQRDFRPGKHGASYDLLSEKNQPLPPPGSVDLYCCGFPCQPWTTKHTSSSQSSPKFACSNPES